MTSHQTLHAAILLALGLATASVHAAAPVTSVAGEPVRAAKATPAPTWRLAEVPAEGVVRFNFRELDLERINEVQKRNARGGNMPVQIGVGRDSAVDGVAPKLAPLRWTPVAGGAVARLQVSSPDALGLRVGLKLENLPNGVELRFAGSLSPDRLLLVKAEEARGLLADGLYWTPVTDGDIQTIEVFAPTGVDPRSIRIQAPQLSHLLTNSIERFSLAKAIGDSGDCNVDTVCRIAALGQNFVNTKNAVARMAFSSGGSTFTCTGTLLNDTNNATQVPYFYSAHHCLSDQTVANTLNTFWGFEATTCGGSVAAANTQLTGGADYLYSNATTDGLLLRLKSTPPAGAFFNGWDAAQVPNSTQMLAVHHPQGDLKKSSLGQKVNQDAAQFEVRWTSGTTEGGSSGSGAFTNSGSDYRLRGGLLGGFASCANDGDINDPNNADFYSRLDLVYPNISQYLAPTVVAPGPSRNNTGLWYVPAESGWGITAFQFTGGSQVLFLTWYVYDSAGTANWYQLDGTWTGTDVNSGPVRKYTGPAWGNSFNAANVAYTEVGTGTISFTSATSATFTYTVEGATRTVTLSKIGG